METTECYNAVVLVYQNIEESVTPIKKNLLVAANSFSEAEEKLKKPYSDRIKSVEIISIEKTAIEVVL